jgi:hypothetical protein
MISIVHEGIAIPVYWLQLPHRGNSSRQTRVQLVQHFIDTFGTKQIAGLLADCAFIGEQWLNWLNTQSVPFIIRVKHNLITTNKLGG